MNWQGTGISQQSRDRARNKARIQARCTFFLVKAPDGEYRIAVDRKDAQLAATIARDYLYNRYGDAIRCKILTPSEFVIRWSATQVPWAKEVKTFLCNGASDPNLPAPTRYGSEGNLKIDPRHAGLEQFIAGSERKPTPEWVRHLDTARKSNPY